MARQSNYDKYPYVPCGAANECAVGWDQIAQLLPGAGVICVESYPGVLIDDVERELTHRLRPAKVFSRRKRHTNPLRTFAPCCNRIWATTACSAV